MKVCSVEGCERKHVARGYCKKHYHQARNSGKLDALPALPETWDDFPRFWSKVAMGRPDDCWVWRSSADNHGYGQFRFQSTTWKAYRVSWFLKYGEVPHDPFVLDHLCRNRPCVNPSHLEVCERGP